MNTLALALALHVVGVVWWIGGVAMVTTVLLPMLRRSRSPEAERLALMQEVERRFAAQARIAVLLVGASGVYMMQTLHAWTWLLQPPYWWLWAMMVVWAVFALVLFVVEPLHHHRQPEPTRSDVPERLERQQRLHLWLLAASIITVLGAAAGAHGWLLFTG